MIETIETGSEKVLGVKLRGTLHDDDYKQFEPQIETVLTREGKVRLFVQFDDFHGWDMQAAWDDFKFGLKHYSDFERIAMVGDRKWEKWMAALCKPFTKAQLRYFDKTEVEAAWKWIRDGHDKERPEPEEEDRTMDSSGRVEAWRGFPWYGF